MASTMMPSVATSIVVGVIVVVMVGVIEVVVVVICNNHIVMCRLVVVIGVSVAIVVDYDNVCSVRRRNDDRRRSHSTTDNHNISMVLRRHVNNGRSLLNYYNISVSHRGVNKRRSLIDNNNVGMVLLLLVSLHGLLLLFLFNAANHAEQQDKHTSKNYQHYFPPFKTII